MTYSRERTSRFVKDFITDCHLRFKALLADTKDQEPVLYLQERGLADVRLVDYFKIGYLEEPPLFGEGRTSVATLENKFADVLPYVKKNSHARQSLGSQERNLVPCIYGPAGNHLFEKRLIFPIFGPDGAIVNIYGRSIERDNPFRHQFSSNRWNWYNLGRPAIRNAKAMVVTESIIDSLTFVMCGIQNVTMLCAGPYQYGPSFSHTKRVEFMSGELLDQLRKMTHVETIYICFDKDANLAGDVQAVSLAKILAESGFEVKLLHLPPGDDPNSLYLKCGDTDEKRRRRFLQYFTDMVENAGDFVIEEAVLQCEHLGLTKEQLAHITQLFTAIGRHYARVEERAFDTSCEGTRWNREKPSPVGISQPAPAAATHSARSPQGSPGANL